MKNVLTAIVDSLENLAISVDAIESVLVQKGVLTELDIQSQTPLPAAIVQGHLKALRNAIASL